MHVLYMETVSDENGRLLYFAHTTKALQGGGLLFKTQHMYVCGLSKV